MSIVRLFAFALAASAGASLAQGVADWQLVRTVRSPSSGPVDLVVIPELKQKDSEYYLQVANVVCGAREFCMVQFWTDPARVPETASIPIADLAAMTAAYERHPSYKQPILRLSCRLYPTREIGELMRCAYFPGSKLPWQAGEDSARGLQVE